MRFVVERHPELEAQAFDGSRLRGSHQCFTMFVRDRGHVVEDSFFPVAIRCGHPALLAAAIALREMQHKPVVLDGLLNEAIAEMRHLAVQTLVGFGARVSERQLQAAGDDYMRSVLELGCVDGDGHRRLNIKLDMIQLFKAEGAEEVIARLNREFPAMPGRVREMKPLKGITQSNNDVVDQRNRESLATEAMLEDRGLLIADVDESWLLLGNRRGPVKPSEELNTMMWTSGAGFDGVLLPGRPSGAQCMIALTVLAAK
jgi:hypothetical protein